MKNNNNFRIIRLIAAIMVITGHMFVLIGCAPPIMMWNSIHSLGVAFFCVIGGYLITLGWLRRPDFKQYLVKRIFRIFPALIACVLFVIFMIGPLVTELSIKEYFSNSLTWRYLLNCVLYINYVLPGVFENNIYGSAVNGSLWFLPVQFLMYLLIPVYVGIGNRISVKAQKTYYIITTLFVIAFRCIWTTWFDDTLFVFYGMSFSQIMRYCIPYYFVGCLFAVCKLENILNLQIAVVAIIGSAMCSFLPAFFSHCLESILIPYVVLSLALTEKPVFATAAKIDISYGMFLFSFIIQQTLIQIFILRDWDLNVWLLIILSVFISLIMGTLTERFIEQPSRKICKKIVKE